MAKQYAKRVAADNTKTLSQLKIGFLVSNIIHLLHFLVFKSTRTTGKISMYIISEAFVLFLWKYLISTGSPKYDHNGILVKSGDDLSQQGFMGYIFDVIYITWAVHVLSALISSKFYYLYIVVPIFAIYKLWSSVIQPYILPRFFGSSSSSEGDDVSENDGLSKRQKKMEKRGGKTVRYRS